MIPGLGRSAGEGISHLLQYSWAQLVKNPPAMWEAWVQSLGCEDSPGEGNSYPPQYSGLEKTPRIVQSVGSQRVGHDESLSLSLFVFNLEMEKN